jgi:predicted metal-dependent phosphotriesterase family hydrolase
MHEQIFVLFIEEEVVPALLRAGVSAEQVDEIMIVNPARYFSA